MRRLLVLISSCPFGKDDSGDWAFKFISYLNYKFKISVLVPHSQNLKYREDYNNFKVYRFPYFSPRKFQRLAYGTGGIPYNIKSSHLAKIQVPIFLISQVICTIKIALSDNIEVINSHWLVPQGFVGALCKLFLKKSHVAILHSSEMTILKKIPMGKQITEFIVQNSDLIISVSAHRANELLSFISPNLRNVIKGKIRIIPMGVDLNEFNKELDKDKLKVKYGINSKYVVLFIGRFVEVKGCKYLIHAFKILSNIIGDAQLIIIGYGALEYELRNLVEELGLGKYIRFEGKVNYNEVANYYMLSDIVAIPSIVDSSGFEEGLPVVLLEALAAGKPIIASRTKGFQEVIENEFNGLLVEPRNPKQLADATIRLISDPPLRDKISKNALKTGSNFSWEIIAEKYTKTIEGVL